MKRSQVEAKLSETISDKLIELKSRAGEYNFMLDPLTHATLQAFLEKGGFDTIEDYLKANAREWLHNSVAGDEVKVHAKQTILKFAKALHKGLKDGNCKNGEEFYDLIKDQFNEDEISEMMDIVTGMSGMGGVAISNSRDGIEINGMKFTKEDLDME